MYLELSERYNTRAFHPGTFGTLEHCELVSVNVEYNTAVVEFNRPTMEGKTRFKILANWLEDAVQPYEPHSINDIMEVVNAATKSFKEVE